MNTTNYKQYDTRWAKLPYKNNPDNIGNNGCGMVAVCNGIIEMVSQMNETPATMQPHCRQYACHDGTYWSAIPKMLEYYGCTEVMEHQNMSSLWNELAKGNRIAIYMMNKYDAGYNKIHWTSGGHFIVSTDYKYENGEHWVYVKDSNSTSSSRNGFITYEGNMKGDVSACWSGKLNGSPAPTPTPTPTPKRVLVVDGVGGYETVMRLQEFFNLPNPDGYIGGQYATQKKYRPALTAVKNGRGGSMTVTALQKWCNLSDPDGYWGGNTSSGLQRKLRDLGYLPKDEAIDNICGKKTMSALQECLNNDGNPKPEPTPPTPPTPTPTTDTKVIDVSAFQDAIDWAKVKAAGIDGAMVRCGYRGYETGKLNQDSMFVDHLTRAHKAGLKVGVYFFTEAINYNEGKEEAEYTLDLIEKMGIDLYYPIAIDSEAQSAKTERAKNLTKAQRTDAIKGFADTINARGGKPMLYASTNWLDNKVDMSILAPIMDVWCAQYYSECQYKGKYVMWQYTSTGKVNGVSGNVDMNHCYLTSPAPMPTPTPVPPTPPTPSGEHYQGAYPEVNRSKQLVDTAVELAWAKGTPSSVYKYPSGNPTEAFRKALDKVYPEHNKWGKAPSKGASCDVFVGTCMRDSGIDPTFPRGLDTQYDHTGKNFLRYQYKNARPIDKSQDGDAIYLDRGRTAHILIRGNGIIYEAEYEASYGHVTTSLTTKNSNLEKAYPSIVIYRPRNYLEKGDSGQAVYDLQNYLDWYFNGEFFKECGKADGVYGNNTFKYVVAMQTDFFGASEADGTVGAKTIAKMKEVTR